MKTIKRISMPIATGVISSIIPSLLNYEITQWQYWLIGVIIISMSWIVFPLHEKINKNN